MEEEERLLHSMLADMDVRSSQSRSPRKRPLSGRLEEEAGPPEKQAKPNAFDMLQQGSTQQAQAEKRAKQAEQAERGKARANCGKSYYCSHVYEVLRLVTVFDPSIAAEKLTADWVAECQ
jgi:hypothetical protein